MSKLLVCNVAALAPQLIADPDRLRASRAALGDRTVKPVKPAFPAVTCTAQATYTTGQPPVVHGIVANGIYDPQRRTVSMWEQAAGLIPAARVWEVARRRRPGTRTAYLFWWNGMHSTADVFMNVAPFHFADGRMVSSCYSRPADLYGRIAAELGPFPLHRFWGPITSIESSEWIAGATKRVLDRGDLDLVFTYLPHMDYCQQKFGPRDDSVAADMEELDGVLAELIAHAHARDFEVLVVSEYGIGSVCGAVELNREFRRQGWVAVRDAEGSEMIDIGACNVFALVDHQVAQIYTRDIDTRGVAEFVASLDGVGEVLVGDELHDAAIDHLHAGSIVAVAQPDKWFAYYWWMEDARAPDFSGTIDIHRKPGFDPLEMFVDPATKRVSLDTLLVKGSHGRIPKSTEEWAVALADFPLPSSGELSARSIFQIILDRVAPS